MFYDRVENKLLENFQIMLAGEINSTSALQLKKQLLYLESIDSDREINIYIDSPGGSVNAALSIIDVTRLISNRVHGIVFGSCYSAASLLLVCLDRRSVLQHSEIMIHQSSQYKDGVEKYYDLQNQYLHSKKVMKTIVDLYKSHSYLSEKELETLMHHDSYFTPIEALEAGLIDEIITASTR